MALLYVTEFGATFADANGGGHIVMSNLIVNQSPLAVGATAILSLAFSRGTRILRLNLDSNGGFGANIAISTNPVAVANISMRMSPNATEYFAVSPGDKVSVIVSAS